MLLVYLLHRRLNVGICFVEERDVLEYHPVDIRACKIHNHLQNYFHNFVLTWRVLSLFKELLFQQ
jgi:hypothetical protein